jgi:hypothetical protein
MWVLWVYSMYIIRDIITRIPLSNYIEILWSYYHKFGIFIFFYLNREYMGGTLCLYLNILNMFNL